jgi:long-chain acyl-CoA synthetase
VKEFCVYAANYLWPARALGNEQLVAILHPEPGRPVDEALRADLAARNERLLPYKRISGYLVWEEDFPRTASMKIKRGLLAEQVGRQTDRTAMVPL